MALPSDDPLPNTAGKSRAWWRWFKGLTLVTIEIEVLRYPLQFRYIFRVVDDAELASIAACNCFSLAPGGLEVKQFWTTAMDAEFWATVGQQAAGMNKVHRSTVYTAIRQETWNLGLVNGALVPEPYTAGHLDYTVGTLPILNADIQSNPLMGRIKILRDHPAVP